MKEEKLSFLLSRKIKKGLNGRKLNRALEKDNDEEEVWGGSSRRRLVAIIITIETSSFDGCA